ncbi:hypothetical protein [Nocardia sp. NPDC004722]
MHHNDVRAIIVGLTGGVIATLGTIAFLDHDFEQRIPEAINRWRLSPVERAEYDEIRAQQAARRTADQCEREQAQVEIRAQFRPELLHGSAMALSQLPIPVLISEIRYAKHRKCSEMAAADRTYPVVSDARVWGPQLEALRSEFGHRDLDRMSFLDGTRYRHAYSYITSHTDEWAETPVYVPAPTREFFAALDSDEAQALTVAETLGDSAEQQ